LESPKGEAENEKKKKLGRRRESAKPVVGGEKGRRIDRGREMKRKRNGHHAFKKGPTEKKKKGDHVDALGVTRGVKKTWEDNTKWRKKS